ncbi:hypothetical protein FGD67_03355 [Colwellia sp. M166]|nr:hypothetical protein FGD67_03355 [Colwellia sp. M166]
MKFKRFSGTGSQFQIEPKYNHVDKALIIEINNTACKPFKINLQELTSDSITAVNFLHIE